MHSNASILRTAASGDEPLTVLRDRFPVGLILRDIRMRHRTASQDAGLEHYFKWRVQRLSEMYGNEISHQDVKYELDHQLRQLTQWKYLLRKA